LPSVRKSKRLLRVPIRKQNLVDRDTESDAFANREDGKSEMFYSYLKMYGLECIFYACLLCKSGWCFTESRKLVQQGRPKRLRKKLLSECYSGEVSASDDKDTWQSSSDGMFSMLNLLCVY
jgi:hypothetical protein